MAQESEFPIIQIDPEWVLEPEQLGSKEKFWFKKPGDKGPTEWLFKFPQSDTGQHWAEKIAAEVADLMEVLHAKVELAIFLGQKGVATESFARDGRELFHGNQILALLEEGYDPNRRFQQSSHTLHRIFSALDMLFVSPDASDRAKRQIGGYLVLDAVIGNTDRHHENWGILRKKTGTGYVGYLAPSFDHASSLGRELHDEFSKKNRYRILDELGIETYAKKAPGAVFWEEGVRHGPSPRDLVKYAVERHPDYFHPALELLDRLHENALVDIVQSVPEGWMSPLARKFAVMLMLSNINYLQLLKL